MHFVMSVHLYPLHKMKTQKCNGMLQCILYVNTDFRNSFIALIVNIANIPTVIEAQQIQHTSIFLEWNEFFLLEREIKYLVSINNALQFTQLIDVAKLQCNSVNYLYKHSSHYPIFIIIKHDWFANNTW